MIRHGIFGEIPEIVAFCHVYKCSAYAFNLGGRFHDCDFYCCPPFAGESKFIFLTFDRQHYDALRLESMTSSSVIFGGLAKANLTLSLEEIKERSMKGWFNWSPAK